MFPVLSSGFGTQEDIMECVPYVWHHTKVLLLRKQSHLSDSTMSTDHLLRAGPLGA